MSVQKVEVVKPYTEVSELWATMLGQLINTGLRVLLVWWAIAAWFPELGITYWQAILPVLAFRMLVTTENQVKYWKLRK